MRAGDREVDEARWRRGIDARNIDSARLRSTLLLFSLSNNPLTSSLVPTPHDSAHLVLFCLRPPAHGLFRQSLLSAICISRPFLFSLQRLCISCPPFHSPVYTALHAAIPATDAFWARSIHRSHSARYVSVHWAQEERRLAFASLRLVLFFSTTFG